MGWIILISHLNNLRRIMKTNKTIMLMLIGTKSTTNNNDHQLINQLSKKGAKRNSLVLS